jgi:pseudo-rSAM protein
MTEYIIIEPYVLVKKNKNKIIFYNTVNGILLEYYFKDEIWTISENIIKVKGEKPSEYYNQFIDNLANKQMVFKFKGEAVFAPNIFSRILTDLKQQIDSQKHIGNDELMKYVFTMTICLNGTIRTLKNLDFLKLQFDIFSNSDKGNGQIRIDTVKNIFLRYSFPNLTSISVTGNQLYMFHSFYDFIIFLGTKYKVKLFISYGEYTQGFYKTLPGIEYHIICDDIFFKIFPFEYEKFFDENVFFHLFLTNKEELFFFREHEPKIKLLNFRIEPYYSNNDKFITKLISFSKEDLFENKKSLMQIIRNSSINELFFGNIIIHNNGDVFSNIQTPPLGNIEFIDLSEILFRASEDRNSWLYSRSLHYQCSECLFNCFCPPVTLIELTSKAVYCKGIT